ncbi:MAG: hypothetical protein ABGX04_14970 [Myxococcales bacterium]|nr:hypothetical protein [Myxococcales bacterium]HIK85848.1 hypothetical protein [Myxococcales bacterium]
MNRRLPHGLFSVLFLLSVGGCTTLGLPAFSVGGEGEGPDGLHSTMTQSRLETLFGDEVDAIVGPPGAIQTRMDGVPLFLLSDEENDRMKLIAQIASASNFEGSVFGLLIQANFDRTLDARYAISDGVIFAVFQHPISSLTPGLIRSAVSQVLNLAENFNSTYAAGGPRPIAAPTDDL